LHGKDPRENWKPQSGRGKGEKEKKKSTSPPGKKGGEGSRRDPDAQIPPHGLEKKRISMP